MTGIAQSPLRSWRKAACQHACHIHPVQQEPVFMFMIVGVLLIGMAVAIPRARSIRSLQSNLPLTEKKGV